MFPGSLKVKGGVGGLQRSIEGYEVSNVDVEETINTNSEVKVLGVTWDVEKDTFKFDVKGLIV